MTQAVAPNRIRIDAQRKVDGTWTLVHRETFDPEHEALRAPTLELFAKLAEPNITARPEGPFGIRVTYSGITRERCSNIVCGEFMQWATMGQMKFADILMSVLALAAESK